MGPVKSLFTIIQNIVQASECIFVAHVNTSSMTRKDLHNESLVSIVSNPSSEGMVPVKALSAIIQKMVRQVSVYS
jgi:hypothetical protein